MFLLEAAFTWADAGLWAVGLITTGTLGGGITLGVKAYKRFRELTKDNTTWKDYITDLVAVGKENIEEGKELAGQLMALSRAVKNKDGAIARINDNAKLRETLLEHAAKLSPEAYKALADVLVPVKADIRNYAGVETDKLAVLKKAMEEDLSKQEANNKLMTTSGKMAALIGKVLVTAGPGIIATGKVDITKLAEAVMAEVPEKPVTDGK